MLSVQFVDSENDSEVQLLINVNHALPTVGDEMVTHHEITTPWLHILKKIERRSQKWIVESYKDWSLNDNQLFVRCYLKKASDVQTERKQKSK